MKEFLNGTVQYSTVQYSTVQYYGRTYVHAVKYRTVPIIQVGQTTQKMF